MLTARRPLLIAAALLLCLGCGSNDNEVGSVSADGPLAADGGGTGDGPRTEVEGGAPDVAVSPDATATADVPVTIDAPISDALSPNDAPAAEDRPPPSDASSPDSAGGDGGPHTCGTMTCGPSEVCVHQESVGGAIHPLSDAGVCPPGTTSACAGRCCTGYQETLHCASPPSECDGGDCACRLCQCMCVGRTGSHLTCRCLVP